MLSLPYKLTRIHSGEFNLIDELIIEQRQVSREHGGLKHKDLASTDRCVPQANGDRTEQSTS
jgi:hypothetical protein